MRPFKLSRRLAALSLLWPLSLALAQKRPVTIEDCIEMVRVQQTYRQTHRADDNFVFSSDGRQFLAVIWRGDLATNLNDYTLLLFDATNLEKKPVELLTVSYSYDSEDQHFSPLTHLAFLASNRVAALATLRAEPRQVVSIDLTTKAVRPLTKHPSGVLAFAAAPDARALVYAAESPPDTAKKAALFRDGLSLEDREAIGPISMVRLATGDWFRPKLQYFLVRGAQARPKLIYEGPLQQPKFWMSTDGRYAVVYPYVGGPGDSPTLGLIDIDTGKIERLLPPGNILLVHDGTALHERRVDFDYGSRVLWSRDSKSFLIFSAGPNATGALSVPGGFYSIYGADLYEVTLATGRATWAKIGRRYELVGWTAAGDGVLFTRGGREIPTLDPEVTAKPPLAILRRSGSGWDELKFDGGKYDLNYRYPRGTNGRLIAGVKDSLSEPPEIVAYDLETKTTRVLTDLNPQLRNLSLGEITRIRWRGPQGTNLSLGYLVKPVDFVPGKRYPVIIQWKDEYHNPDDNSFILDAQGLGQYNGAAVQVWANSGFMVLLTPFPGSVPIQLIPKESEHMLAHIESGLDLLESQGLIDRNQVAIAGWSWAGWQTEYVLTHAKTRFAAAATTDNIEYNLLQYSLGVTDGWDLSANVVWGGALPWGESAERWRAQAIDFKYDQAQTPWLIEVHGARNVMYYAETYAALKTAKIPVDFYLYPDAPHSLKSPVHRLHSLATHTDWFRFWLQSYEDADPAKVNQYARWRKLRADWEAIREKETEQKRNPEGPVQRHAPVPHE